MKKSFLSVLLMALLALALPGMALAASHSPGGPKKYIPPEEKRIQSSQRAQKKYDNNQPGSKKDNHFDKSPGPPKIDKRPGPPKNERPDPPKKGPRPRPYPPSGGSRVEREVVYLPSEPVYYESEPVYYESEPSGYPEATPSFNFGISDGAGTSLNFGMGGGGFGFGISVGGLNY
ncbi:MAG: hypothetical protein LBE80_02705 [Deltaproteobacteria bacterium]|jgi:hypothetical protein|nr:hypothetical protein [Deltaproteobacteria bacterium]